MDGGFLLKLLDLPLDSAAFFFGGGGVVLRTLMDQSLQCACFVGRDSSVGIATELRAGRAEDRIPMGVRFSAPVQTGPGAHPASCTMGTVSLSGRGKAAGAWC